MGLGLHSSIVEPTLETAKGPAFLTKAGPKLATGRDQAAAWALAISFLIFWAAVESSSSLAFAR